MIKQKDVEQKSASMDDGGPSPSVQKPIPSPRAENQEPQKSSLPKKEEIVFFGINLSFLFFQGKTRPLFCKA